jgi:pimeloyl-ACP methyl ester carboxylesterase
VSNLFQKLYSQNRFLLVIVVSVVLLSLWLLASVYLTFQAESIIFNNQVSWAPIPAYGYKLDFVKNSRGENLSFWFFENEYSDEVILYLHGNTGRLAYFFPELIKKANILSPAYPGYHESEGKPSVDSVYETAFLAYEWLVQKKGFPENKITILGHSLGGSPAIYLASKKPQAKQLVLINTFSSIQSLCFRQYSILCVFSGSIFNSAEQAKEVLLPVRHFAYSRDLDIPFEENQKLFQFFAKSKDKKFFVLDGYTHAYPNFDQILPEI